MKIQSIRLKLKVTMVSIILMMFLALAVPFLVVYKDYFLYQQQDLITSVYGAMEFNVLSIDEIVNQCLFYETKDNVNYVIFKNSNNFLVYTSSNIIDKNKYTYDTLYTIPKELNIKNLMLKNIERPYIITKVVNNISNTESMHLITNKVINNQIYTIVIERSIANAGDSSRSIILFLFMFIIPISVIACYVISRVSEYFIWPIVEISDKTQELANLNFEHKIIVNTNDEIGLLAQNINKLSEELEHKIHELEKTNDSLKLSIEAKDKNSKIQEEFISNVSHELKTPITLILGYSEALKMDIDEDSEEEYIEIILNESHKMNDLISNLLDMAKLKSGDSELIVKTFDIVPMLMNIETKYQLLFEDKNILFTKKIPFEEMFVVGDKFKLELVVTNYIVNAIRYVDSNKKINLNVFEENDYINIEIFNTSPQIKPEDLDRIWGSFYKIDKAHSREKGGTGIGLYIVKTIMELHGYEYGIRNTDNGVIFHLKIKKATIQ